MTAPDRQCRCETGRVQWNRTSSISNLQADEHSALDIVLVIIIESNFSRALSPSD
jgi:hypothetical protein